MPAKRKKPNANTRTRDYKKIYKSYHKNAKRKKYRADLQRARRKAGKKANGKDMAHGKDGKIRVGNRKANRRDGQRKSVAARRKNKRRRD